MNKKERALIEEVYKDCCELEKIGMLTEYGQGQRDLCRMTLYGKDINII